ncbi:hypothetical protein FN846DRAFT_894153 [Sphaerosporella brunnea]|uniref:DUF4219 domain-containing protein n=1 Tax=Sphaerosporella brunnea TaxID=1250544 RepID=A0A5J5EJQ2_9PEZI|nr:hypothetical protein FN846DRAFT_894153 [Sphaerosporella brunnea]
MARVLLKEHNYLEWEEYIRDELLARALWGIVQSITKPPQKPTPMTKTETAAAPVNTKTPASTHSAYMSNFHRYLIQLDPSNDKVDNRCATAPDVLWKNIDKGFNRATKNDANVGLYKVNAIREADFDSAAA